MKRIACRIWVERAVGKRLFALLHRRWEGNNKVALKQIGWLRANLVTPAQSKDKRWAMVNTKINLRVPSNAGGFVDYRRKC